MRKSLVTLVSVGLAWAGCIDRGVPPDIVVAPPDPLPAAQPVPVVGASPLHPQIAPEPPPLSAVTSKLATPPEETSIKQVRVITLRAEILGVQTPGQVALELVGPSGMPYERRTSRVVAKPFETQTVEFELPVAATMIEREQMHGAWSANFFVDGSPVASESFELTP
jgi:hypothetical protein